MESIKVKKLFLDSTIPKRASDEAAGYDIYSHDEVSIKPEETVKVSSGIAVSLPKGYFGAVFARSGLALKQGLRPANCVGVIDSDYRGEVIVALHNDSDTERQVTKGERIAQLVIIPCFTPELEESEDLDETHRGEGGFGSTGI
ncbi:MAG: dUTP diphosphatase [Christensenellaceae bacterium]|nr:dUTP diphosphatase [Christensenellaceae bacterium]